MVKWNFGKIYTSNPNSNVRSNIPILRTVFLVEYSVFRTRIFFGWKHWAGRGNDRMNLFFPGPTGPCQGAGWTWSWGGPAPTEAPSTASTTAGGGANACGSARLVKTVRYTSLIGKFASTPMPLFFGLQKLAGREAYQYLCPKFWQDYCDYQREKLLGGNDRPVRIHDRQGEKDKGGVFHPICWRI